MAKAKKSKKKAITPDRKFWNDLLAGGIIDKVLWSRDPELRLSGLVLANGQKLFFTRKATLGAHLPDSHPIFKKKAPK